VKGASAGDSKLATGHLLQKVTYPDSASGTDVVTFAYNAQGQQIWKKDQAGNVLETNFDTAGRETHRRVTTLDADFDGAVRRISRTYNSRGLPELVTQYDNATVGSGTVADEVKYSYEGWGLISAFEQDRNSAVGAGGSVDDYEVSYTYVKATNGRNSVRRTFATLPSGNSLEYQYRNSGGLHDEEAGRVTLIVEGSTALVNYNYNGLDSAVGSYYYEPDVMSRQYGATSGSYIDLDRFNRVTTSKWTKDLATDVDFYNVALVYDRNSNISSAEDKVHTGFDVVYTNDSLNRLVRAEEGTLSSGSITSRSRDQQWVLTQVGNWDEDKLDLNGDGNFTGTDEWHDARTHNDVNELLGRDLDNDSTDEHTLVYDEAGNLTDDGENYTYVWDAFYRLRKIKERGTGDLVAEYKYNGLGYRISIHEDTDTDGDVDGSDVWYHHAFDERWRWVGTFRDTDSDPKEEFLHHGAGLDGFGEASFIDLVAYRDRDANTAWTSASDGTLEERMYYCQNWRADVSALVTRAGTMLEWVKYSAYGKPFGLPGGDADSDGDCDSTDITQIATWISAPAYDVRGDINLDGILNSWDQTVVGASFQGVNLGWSAPTQSGVANKRFSAGRIQLSPTELVGDGSQVYHVGAGLTLSRTVVPYRVNGYVLDLPLSQYESASSNLPFPNGRHKPSVIHDDDGGWIGQGSGTPLGGSWTQTQSQSGTSTSTSMTITPASGNTYSYTTGNGDVGTIQPAGAGGFTYTSLTTGDAGTIVPVAGDPNTADWECLNCGGQKGGVMTRNKPPLSEKTKKMIREIIKKKLI